jgi:hypothetical protein
MTKFILKRKLTSLDVAMAIGLTLIVNAYEVLGNSRYEELVSRLLYVNAGILVTFAFMSYALPWWTKHCTIEVTSNGIRKNSFNGMSCDISWNEISSVAHVRGMFYSMLIIEGPSPKKIIVESAMDNFKELHGLLKSKGINIC